MPLGPGESLKFLNIRLNRTQAYLAFATVVISLCVLSGAALWGVWGWNRANINTDESDIDKLQSQVNGILRESFYVCGNGSDKNPGTEEKPWLTIKHAAEQLRIKKGVELHICNGTFDVNGTDLKFSFVEVYGTAELSADLNVTSVTSLGYGKYRLNVTNALVAGTLVNMYITDNQAGGPAIVYDNGADYVITVGRPGSVASLTTYGAGVYEQLTTINIHGDSAFNYLNGSSSIFQLLIFNTNNTQVVTSRPNDVSFQACHFLCNGHPLQFARSGNFYALSSYFSECNINTFQAVVKIERCIHEDGTFTVSGGEGIMKDFVMNKQFLIQSAAVYSISSASFEVDGSNALGIYSSSIVNMADIMATSTPSTVLIVEAADVYITTTVLSNDVTNSMMFINDAAEVHFNGIHMIRTAGNDGRMIDARKSRLFFKGTDYLFKGLASSLLYAEQTSVVMDNGFFIGNQSIDGAGIGHMIVFTGGSEASAEDVTIELTNLTNPGVLFENSRGTFTGGTITLETGSDVGIEITGGSQVVLDSGVTLDVNTSSANVENSPVYISEGSELILKGTSDLSNDAGTCVYATLDSTVIHAAGADTTLFCGLREFQLRYFSSLLFSNDSTATLSLGTADNTTLGGDNNATSYYLGTPLVSYTDGVGAGLEVCYILTTP